MTEGGGEGKKGNTRWMIKGSFKSHPPRILKPKGSLTPSRCNVISMATDRSINQRELMYNSSTESTAGSNAGQLPSALGQWTIPDLVAPQ